MAGKLIILQGLPGSGKSTWAEEEVLRSRMSNDDASQWIRRINKDSIRAVLGQPWSRAQETEVLKVRDELISDALKAGKTVISDDTNFAPVHVKTLKALAQKFRATVEIKRFDTPLDECIARDAKRSGSAHVGEKVIRDMAEKYLGIERPLVPYVPKPLTTRAVICDLDGTLALFHGLRGPFDYARVQHDKVNKPILTLLRAMVAAGFEVVYLSGREDVARDGTMIFLEANGAPKGPLFMRRARDMRKDWIVKSEIFDAHVRDFYDIEFVLDDRDQVVKMWRDLGLTCLQVNYGNF